MRIAVIGAGAIGGTIAAALDKDGHRVSITARGDHLTRIQQHGLLMRGQWGTHLAQVHAGEQLSEKPELALIATKAQDCAAAASANQDQLAAVPVVVVQNGLRGPQIVQDILRDSPVLGGVTSLGAAFLNPGEVNVTTPGVTRIGIGEGQASELATTVSATLAGTLPVKAIDNFVGALWTKLMVNHVNALPAITGYPIQQAVAHDALRRLMTASMRESIAVARANGVVFASLQGFSDEALSRVAALPETDADFLLLTMAYNMGEVPNLGSTLQSIKRGQPTEIDYLNGEVVAAAIGAAAPINTKLTELVHRVERSGVFLTPEQVLAEFS